MRKKLCECAFLMVFILGAILVTGCTAPYDYYKYKKEMARIEKEKQCEQFVSEERTSRVLKERKRQAEIDTLLVDVDSDLTVVDKIGFPNCTLKIDEKGQKQIFEYFGYRAHIISLLAFVYEPGKQIMIYKGAVTLGWNQSKEYNRAKEDKELLRDFLRSRFPCFGDES